MVWFASIVCLLTALSVVEAQQTLLQILSSNSNASEFLASVTEVKLAGRLNQTGCVAGSFCWTVLCPPNSGWLAAKTAIKWTSLTVENKQDMIYGQILTSVLSGTQNVRFLLTDWQTRGVAANLKNIGFGTGFYFLGRGGKRYAFQQQVGSTLYNYINQAYVVVGNIQATNGMIHYMNDAIVTPNSAMKFSDYLRSQPDLSTSLALWTQLITDSQQQYDGYIDLVWNNQFLHATFFVVSNDGWAKVPADQMSLITGNITLMAQIFGYHYAPNQLIFSEWLNGQTKISPQMGFPANPLSFQDSELSAGNMVLQNSNVMVTVNKKSATIIGNSVSIDRAVVLRIDQPLGFIYENPVTLLARLAPAFLALCQTDSACSSALTKSGEGTIFAPNDAAIAKLNAVPAATKAKYLNLLLLSTRISAADMTPNTAFGANGIANALRFKATANGVAVEGRLPDQGFVAANVIGADQASTSALIHVLDAVPGLPIQTVKEFVAAQPSLSQFSALNYLDLLTTSSGGPYTVLVPDNGAMSKMNSDLLTGFRLLNDVSRRNFVFNRTSLPLNLLLPDLLVGQNYDVATANYAFTREVIRLTIASAAPYYVGTVSFAGVSGTISTQYIGAYQCTDGIVYSINQVLYTVADITASICSVPACQ